MIKFLLKAIGYMALALAIIFAVLDLTRSIADSQFVYTPLGKQWFDFNNASLNGFQVFIERKLGLPWLWENVIQNILLAPSWLVFGILAIIFLFLGRPSKTEIADRFRN